jgi:crotonobetainyl-CoA:carnitine CoA-transferase CaiB-like acyl-CoA transferase
MILGDLGADVIKVERPVVGDDTRSWGPPWSPAGVASYYLGANRNKRSIALDLKDPDDVATARALALRSDVVIENFRPGVMQRAGLDHGALIAERPDLVSCRIAGLGRGELPGYDFLAQAIGGLMSITGDPDGEPRKVGSRSWT